MQANAVPEVIDSGSDLKKLIAIVDEKRYDYPYDRFNIYLTSTHEKIY